MLKNSHSFLFGKIQYPLVLITCLLTGMAVLQSCHHQKINPKLQKMEWTERFCQSKNQKDRPTKNLMCKTQNHPSF